MTTPVDRPLPTRRRFLRAGGVVLALPFLEALLPRSAAAATPPDAARARPARAVFLYTPNGVCNELWYPKTQGRGYALSPTLQPLAPLRERFSLLSGLCHPKFKGKHGHYGADFWLTGADMNKGGATYHNTVSVDQVAAKALDGQTRFASLQLSNWDGSGPQAKTWTLSFNAIGNPLPAMQDPARIFDRLFTEDTPQARAALAAGQARHRSILDTVLDQAKALDRELGVSDRRKMDEYMSGVREVEAGIVRAQSWADRPKPRPDAAAAGIDLGARYGNNSSRSDWLKTMYGLITMALRTDSTRIVAFMTGAEGGPAGRWPEFGGSNYQWHTIQHHNGSADALRRMAEIDLRQVELLAGFLAGLAKIDEGGENLLDRTMVLYGSAMNNGKRFENGGGGHNSDCLPTLIAGGERLGLRHGQHLMFPDDATPLSNVLYTMLRGLGIDTPSFQDSTGTLAGIY